MKNKPFSLTEVQKLSPVSPQEPHFIEADDGETLAYYPFTPENPEAAVIVYHGGGLYGNRTYQWIAEQLKIQYNLAVYVVDIRGHGYSGGERGDAPSTQTVWKDVDHMIDFVKKQHSRPPLFLCGHSSGAGLILNYDLWKRPQDIAGYIFLAPFLGPRSNTNREGLIPGKNFLKKARPWVFFLNVLSGGRLFTHTKAVFFNYPVSVRKADPLIVTAYSCAMSMAVTPYDAKGIFEQLKTPFALFIGDQDEQFLPEKVLKYGEYSPTNNRLFEIVPGSKHISILTEAPRLVYEAIKLAN